MRIDKTVLGWEYDNPLVWHTDAHNARVYWRDASEEVRASVDAVRKHFLILAKGKDCGCVRSLGEASRIQFAALNELTTSSRSYTSSTYFTEVNRAIRSGKPSPTLRSMLYAIEKAAVQ